uniref:DUF1294 domain-containing protein n=1 Tax=Candidatus Limisoma sp. TaxID=3076476 RepID=UPI0040285E86
MDITQGLVVCCLTVVNAVAFIVYGIDKYRARNGKWRIPEATLLMLAVVGGSVGAWLGMKVWHHKTRHRKFRYGVPAILLLQIVVATLLYVNHCVGKCY